MAKYKVELQTTINVAVEVEADSLMDAEQQALKVIRQVELDKESLELDDNWEFDSRYYEVDGKPVINI